MEKFQKLFMIYHYYLWFGHPLLKVRVQGVAREVVLARVAVRVARVAGLDRVLEVRSARVLAVSVRGVVDAPVLFRRLGDREVAVLLFVEPLVESRRHLLNPLT